MVSTPPPIWAALDSADRGRPRDTSQTRTVTADVQRLRETTINARYIVCGVVKVPCIKGDTESVEIEIETVIVEIEETVVIEVIIMINMIVEVMIFILIRLTRPH